MLRARSPAAKPPVPALSYARPASDVTNGNWTTNAGATVLYAAIDETPASDADFVQSKSVTTGQSDTCEVALSALGTPSVADFHSVAYRFSSVNSDYAATLSVSLVQGSTVIATWSHSSIPTTGYTTAVQSLTSAQIAAITNYSDLRLRFTAAA